jgi:uncharacterized protein YecE (DUF72 family)
VARGIRPKDRLAFMASLFNSVEINASFYRQLAPQTYRTWREQTPAAFRFALKGHRFVTHYRRLRQCGQSIARLREQATPLGEKLAVVLWQLPATFALDLERLDDFLSVLKSWSDVRHALEFRHDSWFCAEVHERLHHAQVAACLSDAPDFPLWDTLTTDLVYVRLHGHTRKYASRYSAASVRAWARRARAWERSGRQAHLYFDNDAEGAAIRDALALTEELGLEGTGPPPPRTSPA